MSKELIEKPKHSHLGASSAYRWMECPGSVAFLASLPIKKTTSVFATEGTAAHILAEHLIKEAQHASVGDDYVRKMYIGGWIKPKDSIVRPKGNGYPKTDGDVDITEDMVEAVLIYTNEIKEAMKGEDHKELMIESKIDLSFIHEDLYGTNDALIVRLFDRLTVYDYKHGMGVPVEVDNNPQMLYYALGAAHKFNYNFSEIEIVIVQPRCDHPDGMIRRQVISMEELLAFGEQLKLAIARTKEKDAALRSGKWCRFCDAKPICPALRKNAYETAQADFESLETEPTIDMLPEPALMSPEKLARVLQASQVISTWVDSVKEYAHSEAEKGVVIPGYKLVAKRAHRKWKDEDEVVKTALTVGFDYGDIYTSKLKSPAQLDKVLGKDKVAELSFTPESGTNLVQESNKKGAIENKPDFVALD